MTTNVPPSPSPPQAPVTDETKDLERKIRTMLLPDLRIALRARGLSPAGGLDALRERLLESSRADPSALVRAPPRRRAPPTPGLPPARSLTRNPATPPAGRRARRHEHGPWQPREQLRPS